jgi:hypothetical protein
MNDSPPKEFPSVGLIALNLARVWYQSLGSFSQLVNGKPPHQRSSDLSVAVAVTIALSIFNKLILYAFLRMVYVRVAAGNFLWALTWGKISNRVFGNFPYCLSEMGHNK